MHVVDDEEEIRWAIETLLLSAGIEAVAHASAAPLLDLIAARGAGGIGCILADVRMPGLGGLELLHRLKATGFPRPVVVMTAHGDIATAVRAMKTGAFDFIEKPFEDKALLSTLRAALTAPGPGARPEEAVAEASTLPAGPAARAPPRVARAAAQIAALSLREREVLNLAMHGMLNKGIAHELGISPRTVEVHRARMLTRLGVSSLAEAVRVAVLAELKEEDALPGRGPG